MGQGTSADEEATAPFPRSFLPPFRVLPDFLDAGFVAGLLALAERRRAEFAPTHVADRARPEFLGWRNSVALPDFGEFQPRLRAKLRGLIPGLVADLKLTPFVISGMELELVAHGDGAFYKRHIDTATANPARRQRVLSGVYYFHRQPKAFAGGQLRLYAIGDETRFVDVEPEHNTLLVFPSWAPHEVTPVSCPSRDFMDSRFAINCWALRRRTAPDN